MDARRLAVELQLSAKRGTVSGEQVNAVVDALLEMTDKLERLEAENAGLQERIENQRRKLEHAQTPEYVAALEAENAELKREAADTIESLLDRLQDAEDARYDAGFKNGVKACLQQLDGLIHECADVDEIQGWIDRQWEEES